jgi:predicted TIM-barrel fold metal-dependent hydrolase
MAGRIWTRREVLGTGAAALAAVAGCTRSGDDSGDDAGDAAAVSTDGESAAASGNNAPTPIVDTHQHLWDLDLFRLPWTANVPELAKSHRMADYVVAASGLGVEKTIYMEVDVDPSQQIAEAEYVIALTRDPENSMVGAIISGRPDAADFRSYVDRFKNSTEVRGLRRILHPDDLPPKHCLSDAFLAGVRYLGEVGWTFDICIRPGELDDAAALCAACPDTRFVLDHCGNPKFQEDLGDWKRGIAALAKRPNVVCKVSGFVAQASRDTWTRTELGAVVDHVIDHFGFDRLVFGSDWPVCNLRADYPRWVNALRTILAKRSADDRRRLFYENAHRVYGIA